MFKVNTFDEAFTSRIHVALQYKKLRDEDRKAIWFGSFERLKSEGVKVAKAAQKYACESRDVLDLEWNGREIRNGKPRALLHYSDNESSLIPFNYSFSDGDLARGVCRRRRRRHGHYR